MIVLDTHSWIWAMQDDPRLGPTTRNELAQAARQNALRVPAITCWEVAMLVAKNRLALNMDVATWIGRALSLPGIGLEPLHPGIAIESTRLPGEPHGDPADRLIIATARHLDATLVTADGKILAYAAAGHARALDATS